MKYLFLTVFVLGMVVGSVFYFRQHNDTASAGAGAIGGRGAEEKPVIEQGIPGAQQPQSTPQVQVEKTRPVGLAAPLASQGAAPLDPSVVTQLVDTLLSPRASYDQKRAAWNQLRQGGHLDDAIAELQKRLTNNPNDADGAAVLGHAYLMKCGTSTDVREQGILAMQADKLFDTALNLDSQNWEARYNKAVALSYWPMSMGKADEVIDHFTTLIQQQEAQPQQPQFADSYMWLGDQYKKAGRMDDALSVWQRGAYLFPGDQKLTERLGSAR
jgi:tetratricopeptide (TPR) repeat protein